MMRRRNFAAAIWQPAERPGFGWNIEVA